MEVKSKSGRAFQVPTAAEDAVITQAALADPDAHPFTDAEWSAVKPNIRRDAPAHDIPALTQPR